jgi:hypothetical protein
MTRLYDNATTQRRPVQSRFVSQVSHIIAIAWRNNVPRRSIMSQGLPRISPRRLS